MTDSDKATEVSDFTLDEAAGGFFEAWPAKWSTASSKSDNPVLEVAGISPDQGTIIGGFSGVSGLGREIN